MSWICAVYLLAATVSINAQDFICFSDVLCGRYDGVETGRDINEVDCCQHGIAPFGLSFSIEGVEECFVCPIDFGFVTPSFTAEESLDSYPLELAFFSGISALGGFFLTLELEAVTADIPTDISLSFNRIFFPDLMGSNDIEIFTTEILLRQDTTAQESNETFRITFQPHPNYLPGANLRNSFEGVIVDNTPTYFRISEGCYREREGDTGNIPVIITKSSQIFLANPVSFEVIPLTIFQARERRSILGAPRDNQYSPIYADENDFNTTIVIATFPADEGSNFLTDLRVPITVYDDEIDEAITQIFVVILEIFTALNKNLVIIQSEESLCEILDNDPIAIGFQFSVYDFYEPVTGQMKIMNVTMVKEDDRISEQTFGLVINFGDLRANTNAATLQHLTGQNNFDYIISDPGINSLITFFEPTMSEANFSFTIFSDNLVEGTEGFRVSLSPLGEQFPIFMQPSEKETSPYSQALIRIIDANYVVAGFEEPTYTANETDDSVEVCVLLSTSSESISLEYDINLIISLTGVTADDLDFVDAMHAVTVRKTSTDFKECITITLMRDEMFEFSESFFVDLVAAEKPSEVIFNNSRSEVFILDNSEFAIGFFEEQYYIQEGTNSEIPIINADHLQPNITIMLELQNNTAQSDVDYDASNVTFTINFEKPNISLPLIDDNIFEVDECFQVRLMLSETNVLQRLKTNSNNTLIVIEDDDVLEFSSDLAIMESEEVQNLTIRLRNGNIEDLLVILTVASEDFAGNATVGEDYTPLQPTNLTFSKDVVSNTIPIYIEDDGLPEKQEYFEIIVMNVTVIDSIGTESDFTNEIGDRIKMYGATTIEDRVTLKTIVVCYPTPECESGGMENETLESCCMQQSSVFNLYFEVSGSISSRCQPCQFIDTATSLDTSTDIRTVQSSSINVLEISLGVVFGAIGIVVLILAIFLFIFIARWFKGKSVHNHRLFQVTAVGEEEKSHDSEYFRPFTVQSSLKLSVPKKFIVPSCRLKLVSTIGQGEFGMVYKGHIKSGYSDAITDTVAVKTLKGFVEKESVKNLLKECGRMYTLDHPNILKLTGVCMDGGPAPFIIMPFMANGSLKDYLLKERDHLLLESDTADSELVIAVEKNLLDMCSQVAKGMEYLASQRIIHRDLAARNCMIDLNFVIKVADFGLAESLDSSKEYFRQDQDNAIKLPIKWLALESIHDGIFSEKSDVWSFGVTCWEIFNGGKTPYPGIHPADLPLQLDQGLRLEKPNNAAVTDEIYTIMASCWISQSHSRPSFTELVNQLSNLLGGVAGYLDLQAPAALDTKL